MALSDLSKTEAVEKLDRAKSTLQRLRQRSKKTVLQVQTMAGAAVGGLGAGYLSVKVPTIPGTQVQSSTALATGLTFLALSGLIADDQVNDFVLATAAGSVGLKSGDFGRQLALAPPVQRQ
jgi:hypothetical protein